MDHERVVFHMLAVEFQQPFDIFPFGSTVFAARHDHVVETQHEQIAAKLGERGRQRRGWF
jgi:hypothetical protein